MKKLKGLVAPFTKGVSKKIVSLLFLFGIAPLVLSATIFLIFYIELELGHISDIQKEIVERIASDISSHINARLDNLHLFASTSQMRNIDKEKQDLLIAGLLDREKSVDEIAIADMHGKVVIRISRYYSFTASEFGSMIKGESFLTAKEGKTEISQIEISPLSNLPQINITLPIRDMKTNEVAGVLRATVNVGKMWELISSYRIGEERYAYIVDHHGYLIIHKDMATVLQKKNLKNIPIIEHFMNDKTGVFRYSGLNGNYVIGASMDIPALRWGVIVEEPVMSAYKWLYRFSLFFIFVLLLTVSFAVIIGIRFSFRFIIDPIKRLQEGAEAIAGGAFEKKIATESPDELGQLAHSFNVMTKNLQATTVSRDRLVEEVEERKKVESELLKLAAVVERSSELVSLAALDGKMFFLNEAGKKILGVPAGDVSNYSIVDFVSGVLKLKFENEIVPDLLNKSRWEGELQYRNRATGSLVDVHATIFIILNADGEPLYLANVSLDVTERKLAEGALRESEAKYREIFQNAVMGIFRTTPDGRYLSINPAGAKMYGYNSEEEMMQAITDMEQQIYVHAKDRKQMKELLNIRGFVENFESPHYTKNGNIIWVSINVRVIRDNSGAVLYYETTSQDITSRKEAEEAITTEKEKLKTLSDNAPFGMALIDKDGHFTYINRMFTELFGYDLSDIPDGRTWARKAYPDQEYRHSVISAWKEDLGKLRPDEQKNSFTVTCKDRTQKIVQFMYSVLVSGDSLMTCEDVTELRQLENQLRQAQKTEAIGTLAGGIAHDFNNILTALMGYAALIQIKLEITHPLRTYIDEVLSASEKAVDLTQSLLAFSRQQSVNLVPLDMNTTIRTAEKLLRRLLTEDIDFHASFAYEDMIIMADKSQMDQILFNLVTNARDAMPKGGVLTIETSAAVIDNTFIRTHGFGEKGDYVRVCVTDTGTGMDEQTRSKIFDPFFTTKEIGKGTGLGLATVYGIVKQHNGYIIVESTPGEGSSFHIYLPQTAIQIDEKEDMVVPSAGGKETILIAEDNEGVRRFMREILEQYGYTIREAIDGEDAVEKFQEHPDIDLIIIDSVMPRKNGREAYEEIHKRDPHIKVLFTSGYTKDVVLDKGIEEKEFDFIAKPLSLRKLLQKVREVLDR